MKRITILIAILLAASLSMSSQKGLNVAMFFSESFEATPNVTIVNINYDKKPKNGIKRYRSISVYDDAALADQLKQAVRKDGASAESKEVSYKGGDLYFGFYCMGGEKESRKYLLFLNKRPRGVEKATLIYLEGDLDEKEVKSLIK